MSKEILTEMVIPEGTIITGLQATDDYIATKIIQGRRVHYVLSLPLRQLSVMLPVPDPSRVLDDNRQVDLRRAKAFAKYVLENKGWHAGPLTIRTDSSTVGFEAFPGQDSPIISVGMLKVPRINRDGFLIVDGQHRQLGFNILLSGVSASLIEAKQKLHAAVARGEVRELIVNFEKQVEKIELIQHRLDQESIALDLIVEDDNLLARQIFVDVANNALGVPKAVTARFDLRKMVNRALGEALSPGNIHPLLKGRVDHQKDIVKGQNVHWISASKVVELIRITNKGISGRFSKRDEKTADEGDGTVELEMVKTMNLFLEALSSGFPDLRDMSAGNIGPVELRDRGMLGSITMLRVLAGVYFDLINAGLSEQAVVVFFSKLNKHMVVPVTAGTTSGDLWLGTNRGAGGADNEVFVEGATAPSARAQAVKVLTAKISGWAKKPPSGL